MIKQGTSACCWRLIANGTYKPYEMLRRYCHRQRRHFYYLTGCDLPDCSFAYEIDADKSTLWIPPVDPEVVMWAGMPLLKQQAMDRFDVDEVLTRDELKSGESLSRMLGKQQSNLMVIEDRVDLSVFESNNVKEQQNPKIDFSWARKAIEVCRVVKDDHEIAMIRHANAVSSYAHEQVLASVKRAKNERELNAVFVMHCHANGCREQAYGCICASGTNASTLHYVHNDMPLTGRLNLLLDAGCEWQCYCSDITRTFPLHGKFTKESKEIYELVLLMQSTCMKMIRAGVLWEDVHMKAHTVAAEGLRQLGIFHSHLSTQDILDSHITTRFFPHGLGHYLGMVTHDTGGNANYEDPNPPTLGTASLNLCLSSSVGTNPNASSALSETSKPKPAYAMMPAPMRRRVCMERAR
ncbi:hypothetical protein LTR02_015348 [Friedmanniomyces endolithicus]|nr:hypothetical protein LTR02_015348 [Friedmanniomyces endolithicus]